VVRARVRRLAGRENSDVARIRPARRVQDSRRVQEWAALVQECRLRVQAVRRDAPARRHDGPDSVIKQVLKKDR
jgi:hypothetical protein